uniref:BLOC-1-related complex subunit 6 C-terminal helix domain-containing protein n=1 Tax=Cucumis melo TaxID=3656 RepID=A0A9I9DCM6_CUCME
MEQSPADSSTTSIETECQIPATSPNSTTSSDVEDCTKTQSSLSQTQILEAIEVVEKDSLAIAESFTSLFASLRSVLSEVTSNSIDHMHCFNDAAGRLQESVLDAATKGNRYINSSLRLNQEMKGMDNLAAQLYPFCFIPSFFTFSACSQIHAQ